MKVVFTCTLEDYWGIEDLLDCGVTAETVREFLFEDITALMESPDARWEFITQGDEIPIVGSNTCGGGAK